VLGVTPHEVTAAKAAGQEGAGPQTTPPARPQRREDQPPPQGPRAQTTARKTSTARKATPARKTAVKRAPARKTAQEDDGQKATRR